ncbi:MAG: GNAT family N-acetyltransferase [Candidatus Micrarchaeia archaeon]
MVRIRLFRPGDEKGCRRVILTGIKVSEKAFGKKIAAMQARANTVAKIREKARAGGFAVAVAGTAIVGTGRLQDSGEISIVYLLPRFRLRGIGSQLLGYLERVARRRGLKTVFVYSNPVAEKFYLKAGYRLAGKAGVLRCGHAAVRCRRFRKRLAV